MKPKATLPTRGALRAAGLPACIALVVSAVACRTGDAELSTTLGAAAPSSGLADAGDAKAVITPTHDAKSPDAGAASGRVRAASDATTGAASDATTEPDADAGAAAERESAAGGGASAHAMNAGHSMAGVMAGTGGASGNASEPSSRSGTDAMQERDRCNAGQHTCIDDTLYQCDPMRGEFIVAPQTAPCGQGLCNAELGRCNVCVPGAAVCTDDATGVSTCSADGQQATTHACESGTPVCVSGACEVCRVDADPEHTGCAAEESCVRVDDALMCSPTADGMTTDGLVVEFCHAGACKVQLAPHYELDFKVDWSECKGSPAQAPLAADSAGIMLWPTTLVDLAIPLADTGWLCKLPPNGAMSECIVSASYSARELYLWGPVETACSYVWRETPEGIDADLGSGCGMCTLEQPSGERAASYAFNMGTDTHCRCPKVYFEAAPASHAMDYPTAGLR